MAKIFISHASADQPIVEKFFELLQVGCNLSGDDLLCTSAEGYGIETGEQFVEVIAKALRESNLVVLVLSANYYASSFCIAEMGAAWALKRRIFPFTLEGTPRDPGVVLFGMQSQRLDDRGLNAFHEQLLDGGLMDRARTERWSVKRDAFLAELPSLMASLEQSNLVRRSELEEERKKTKTARESLKTEVAQRKALEKRYEALKRLKNREEAAEIEYADSTLEQQFAEHLAAVRETLEPLDAVDKRCVFSSVADSPWIPDQATSVGWRAEIQRAIDRRLIVNESDDGWMLSANDEHPKIQRVLDAIHELSDFLHEPGASGFVKHLCEKHDVVAAVDSLEFFEKIITKGERLLS